MVLCRGDHPISIEPCMHSKECLVIAQMVLRRGDHPISIEPCMHSKEGLVIWRTSSNGPPKRVWS